MAKIEDDVLSALKQYGKSGEIVLETVLAKDIRNKYLALYKNKSSVSILREIRDKLAERKDIETSIIITEVSPEGQVINSAYGYRLKINSI